MPLKVVVVGCGKIAEGHVEEITKIDSGDVVAVCDLEELMAEQLALRLGIPKYYSDFEEMLSAESPDVVHITTPPQSHLPLAMTSMRAGCHVYVEKPFTMDLPDAEKLLAEAEKTNRKVTIGHTFQFDPPALAMRKLIEEGVVGEPLHVESFLGDDLSGPFGAALLGNKDHWVHGLPGKLFQNNINHMLYKITEFMDAERPDVKAFTYKHRPDTLGDHRDDMLDELRVMIKGERVTGYGTYSTHIRPAGQFCRVYGSKSTVHVDYIARTVTVDKGPQAPSAIGRLLVAGDQTWQFFKQYNRNVFRFARSDYHFFSGLNRLISMFYDSIIKDTEPPIAYSDILRITAIMDDIFDQMNQEQKV